MLALQDISQKTIQKTSAVSRPTIQSATRVLCLKLQELPSAGFKRPAKTISLNMITEAFLKFSPRVQMRSAAGRNGSTPCHWLFLDIGSTSHLHHNENTSGEEGLMRSAMSLARDLGFSVQCAIADTPAGAQAFTTAHLHESTDASQDMFVLVPPGEEREWLKNLSLPYLLQLEGLEAWAKPSLIESIVTFFMMLGFKTIGDLSRFTASSFQERWGETGGLLWKRLCAHDKQVISPLLPTEPLEDYIHLDFPVSLTSLLLRHIEKSVDFLFARLQGRQYFAQKLVVILHCEYSNKQHKISIEPNTPNRNRDLFLTLLESRLSNVNLENPIRDLEIKVVPCPEKSHQLDFFQPRTTDTDKTQMLFSLLSQAMAKPGFYKIENSIRPEGGWEVTSKAVMPPEPSVHHEFYEAGSEAIAPRPFYGASSMEAPRPTRILTEPKLLSTYEFERLRPLSNNPVERIENGWWDAQPIRRDYYFAVSPEGECLWIYQDLTHGGYYLHGYFD